jgi:Fe2+ transport system protein FeoA
MLSLDQLRQGQRALVEELVGNDVITQRLMEMGLLEGEEISLLAIAPMGDPLEIRIGDGRLSLRRTEAARVSVRLLETEAH